ncbi:MAG: glycosyltransferase family 2 protein [Phycisphaerae bacterium]|nr:glycosyltransferase family 2 protein [Phycisphaerae bacterium]
MKKQGVSIFIQTLNEEENLPRCLECLAWSDDIVVLDSYSTDRTEEIARAAGARFFQREYDGRANNQNWAVENIDFKYPWVYYSDADEIMPPELAEEIGQVTLDISRPEVCYRLRFKNMLFGRWIKHSSIYPTWVPRLWMPEKIRWRRGANPIAIVDGPEGRLNSHFIHCSFHKGFASWFEKHNKYSQFEAVETIKELRQGRIDWGGIVSSDPNRRRIALKNLSFRMPFRPFFKFGFMYFLRGGLLDGKAGLTYCLLQAIYEFMIVAKTVEMRRKEKDLQM